MYDVVTAYYVTQQYPIVLCRLGHFILVLNLIIKNEYPTIIRYFFMVGDHPVFMDRQPFIVYLVSFDIHLIPLTQITHWKFQRDEMIQNSHERSIKP